jgi:hypothetical protein
MPLRTLCQVLCNGHCAPGTSQGKTFDSLWLIKKYHIGVLVSGWTCRFDSAPLFAIVKAGIAISDTENVHRA